MFPASYPYLLLFLPAAVLARDDFRTRRVDASWLAVLGTVSVGVSWHTLGWRTMLLQTAGNAALLLLSGTALFGYLRLRRLAVRHSVGSGDTLFLLADKRSSAALPAVCSNIVRQPSVCQLTPTETVPSTASHDASTRCV